MFNIKTGSPADSWVGYTTLPKVVAEISKKNENTCTLRAKIACCNLKKIMRTQFLIIIPNSKTATSYTKIGDFMHDCDFR
ncbi:hypothetical protein LBMAG26_11440 [Bacteroidota bacterium]|nr:hypothetical protein LBMAG26_11440 [Bacteroidota bacterium]